MEKPSKKVYRKPKAKNQRPHPQLSPEKRSVENNDDSLCCVVCAHEIETYAVGSCDHCICYKCSMKMRILCKEKFCPVCRKDLNEIILTKKLESFQMLKTHRLLKERYQNVGFYFDDPVIIPDFNKILEHRCPKCADRPPDRDFEQTKAHLRRDHVLFYCDICLEHNRNFTSECKVYSRKDLAQHKRVGDPDDTSHRGHPLCEFCDTRYLDYDTLFHHLRTSHYYCHICDQSDTNEFYDAYPNLRVHFKKDHFLCEQGDCANEEFTGVFATEIDFKAHCASAHRGNKTKQQQKMDRQIDIGFKYTPREGQAGASRRGGSSRGHGPRGGGSSHPTSGPRGGGSSHPISGPRGGGSSHPNSGPRGGGSSQPISSNRSRGKPNAIDAFERDSDLERAIKLSQHEANDVIKNVQDESNPDLKEAPQIESNLSHNKPDAEVLNCNIPEETVFDKSLDFPALGQSAIKSPEQTLHPLTAATTTSAHSTAPKAIRDATNNSTAGASSKPMTSGTGSGMLVTQWNNALAYNAARTTDEDFPALPSSQSKRAVPAWAKRASSAPHSHKSKQHPTPGNKHTSGLNKYSSTVGKEPSSSFTSIGNVIRNNTRQGPSSNSKEAHKVYEQDDFPSLRPENEVVVGRGASKHLECFEKSSAEIQSNVKLISAPAKATPYPSKLPFQHNLEDASSFPSLGSSNITHSTVRPPPGFGKKSKKSKKYAEKHFPDAGAVFGDPGRSMLDSLTLGDDFSGLLLSNLIQSSGMSSAPPSGSQ